MGKALLYCRNNWTKLSQNTRAKFARKSFFNGGRGLSRGVFFNCYVGLLKRVWIFSFSCTDILGVLG
jgi:hypothetical protein